MKKLMIAVAAIACATVGLADDITSNNIVGYNQVTIKGGKWNMFAVNFQKVGDEATGISIQDLIPGTTAGLKAGGVSDSDLIQIYDAEKGSYTQYYLFYTTAPIPALKAKNYKWCNVVGGAVATYAFKNGDSFWYQSKGTTDVTVSLSGGVSLESSQTIDIVPGYNMIGSAFPANFNPNVYGTEYWQTCGAKAGGVSDGDLIQIYNSDTGSYTQYYLFYTTAPIPALKAKNYRWCAVVGGAVIDSTSEVLSATKGAWYQHKGTGFTLTIPTPLGE